MPSPSVQPERLRPLNSLPPRPGRHVLYWMQQSQRAAFNHALEFAAGRANDLGLPLVVGFGLMDDYPEANLRHYRFLLEGLAEVGPALEKRGVKFVVRKGRPDRVALDLAEDAAAVVCDRGYLRHQKAWRERVAANAGREVTQVESDVVVPVDAVSNKAEYAARTLRPKIGRLVERFLVGLEPVQLKHDALGLKIEGVDPSDPAALSDSSKLDRSVPPVPGFFRGGTSRARSLLRRFFAEKFDDYAGHRNRPGTDDVSHMSKYLHFGQISPVEVALLARRARGSGDDVATFLEELIVRRELTQNFVNFTPDYDRFSCLPAWARATLAKHDRDDREHVYTKEEFAAAGTHDPYWNAAMNEMRHTGYTHNHMRMYWGKKILEWSASPEEGYRTALELNNTYFLDGRDPNSYANVAWVFGLHDRPWGERPVYGTVRSMSAAGLERKCDIAAYVAKVEGLVARARGERTA